MGQMNQTDGLTRYFGSLHWFVIHTKPRDEYRVKNHLGGMEIETLLPLYENFQYSHSRMSRVIHPLFPNYLFARLDLERHYYKVKWTRGVNRILGAGNEPIPISETVIWMLKDRMGGDGTVKLLDELQEGDLVQITSGPLKDFIGIFQNRLSSGERVRILVNLIGIEVPVQISRWQIKKAA
jgi:transcription elongation factor/antiterminator RfaH